MRDIKPIGKPKPPNGSPPPNLPNPKKELYSRPEDAAPQPEPETKPQPKRPRFSGAKVPVAATQPEEYAPIPSPDKLSASEEYRAKHHTRSPHKKPARLGDKERKLIAVLFVLVVAVLGLAAFLFLPKANVVLTLQTAPLLLDQELTLKNVSAAEPGVIPADTFTRELTIQGSANVQGREVVGGKATGTARIVNRTVDEQSIKEQSRLVTPDGTLFYMQRHAIVPPEGAVSVPIEAAEAGEAGNIEPGRLDFAALDESAQSVVYAEVDTALTGGSGDEVGVVQESDIEQAKQEAGIRAREQVEQDIAAGLTKGMVLLDESWTSQLTSFTTSAKEGDHADTIQFTADVTVRVFSFEEAALQQALQQALESRLDKNHMLFPEPISFSKTVDDVDWDKKEARISVRVTHTTIPQFSLATLQEKLSGRSTEEAKSYLEGLPGVEAASVELSPFWAPRIPTIEQRIMVDLVPDREP